MKKLEYLKMRQMMIIDLLERYTGTKMSESVENIRAVTDIRDLDKLSNELITTYSTIQDREFKARIDPILQNSHIKGRESDVLVMDGEQKIAILKNEFRFLKPKLLKADNSSPIPLLPIEIYSLIAWHLEKQSYMNSVTGQTLKNYSRACTTFWRASKAQIAKLKEKGPLYQIMLLGDQGAGKSCLRHHFAMGDNHIATANRCSLKIWDPVRGERFANRNANYFDRNTLGYVVVFDLTDQASFNNTKLHLQEIDRYGIDNAVRILVGTKSDLTPARVVDFNTAKEFADSLGLDYIETSAMTGDNISQAFELLAHHLIERFPPPKQQAQARSLALIDLHNSNEPKNSSKSCTVQ